VGALPVLTPFADERGAAAVLLPSARRSELISITPDTVQQILAYAAEKEQALTELKGRISELERLLETDELTGLLNRRGFEHAANRVLANAARYCEKGVLVLIDLDGFKHVNDRHGHAAGDAALKLVGRILNDHIRATDYAARLSGDEFALLWLRALPSALHRRFGDLKRALNTAMLEWNGKKIALQASAGTASYDAKTTLGQLVQRADKAMYRQKRARREEA
jgi:diguanylate cyclase (GGDEF)-like protein